MRDLQREADRVCVLILAANYSADSHIEIEKKQGPGAVPRHSTRIVKVTLTQMMDEEPLPLAFAILSSGEQQEEYYGEKKAASENRPQKVLPTCGRSWRKAGFTQPRQAKESHLCPQAAKRQPKRLGRIQFPVLVSVTLTAVVGRASSKITYVAGQGASKNAAIAFYLMMIEWSPNPSGGGSRPGTRKSREARLPWKAWRGAIRSAAVEHGHAPADRSAKPCPRSECLPDIGCGDGVLCSPSTPEASGVLDFSEPMIEVPEGRQPDRAYRPTFAVQDFGRGDWTMTVAHHAPLPPRCQGFAIHHQPDVRKRERRGNLRSLAGRRVS